MYPSKRPSATSGASSDFAMRSLALFRTTLPIRERRFRIRSGPCRGNRTPSKVPPDDIALGCSQRATRVQYGPVSPSKKEICASGLRAPEFVRLQGGCLRQLAKEAEEVRARLEDALAGRGWLSRVSVAEQTATGESRCPRYSAFSAAENVRPARPCNQSKKIKTPILIKGRIVSTARFTRCV